MNYNIIIFDPTKVNENELWEINNLGALIISDNEVCIHSYDMTELGNFMHF